LISRQILNNNDELIIGKTRVRFFDAANPKSAIQAEPADVIDIREVDSSNDPIEQTEYNEIDEPAAHRVEAAMSDTGSPLPNEQYHDDGLDEILGDDDDNPSRAPLAGGLAAAGAVGAAAVASSARSSNEAADSESMFEALADDLSHRDNATHAHTNSANDNAQSLRANSLDDSSQMSLSDRAKVALGRDASHAGVPAAEQTNQVESRSENHEQPVDLAARRKVKKNGATIQIKNGAKSGHIIPIDKPVTTLGRPGIQIAAIMRKPDGYFLMHIESNDSVDRPTLNNDFIGDEPMLLHPGDELNVAGINVEFDLVSQQVSTSV